MITNTFEIRVALLGHVSVGKTTILNALLQDKFSEVSMRRTTAGINFFRIVSSTSKPDAKKSNGEVKAPVTSVNKVESSWLFPTSDPQMAASTLKEIINDNAVLRDQKTIQEKTFLIELSEPLCEMRKDTSLVIVDIPGLNEADSKQMYLNYVSDKWHTFDCVVVVMDGEKGVNTDEQVELFEFVQKNLLSKKQVPVIVLCNKVDDPDDDELMGQVNEVQARLQKIFDVNDRKKALDDLLTGFENGKQCDSYVYPIFIPLSAGNAFAYRMAHSCSFEKFKTLDAKLIDKLGRDEVGIFNWKKMSLDDKYKASYAAVSNNEEYLERLKATNFDKFLSALSYSVGGERVQKALLKKQLEVSMQRMSLESPILEQVRAMYSLCVALGATMKELKQTFWRLFGKASKHALEKLKNGMDLKALTDVASALLEYKDFAQQCGWDSEDEKAMGQLGVLVRSQLHIAIDKESVWKGEDFSLRKLFNQCPTWKILTHHEWASIISAILVFSSNQHFVLNFTHEKIMLERLLQKHNHFVCGLYHSNHKETQPALLQYMDKHMNKGHCKDGKFCPDHPAKYQVGFKMVMPDSVSNPSHWGYLVYKYCSLADKTK